MSAPAWTVDSFTSDLDRLSSLMSIICEIQFGRAADEIDPRVDDLLWIAREMADGLKAHNETRSARMTGGDRNG